MCHGRCELVRMIEVITAVIIAPLGWLAALWVIFKVAQALDAKGNQKRAMDIYNKKQKETTMTNVITVQIDLDTKRGCEIVQAIGARLMEKSEPAAEPTPPPAEDEDPAAGKDKLIDEARTIHIKLTEVLSDPKMSEVSYFLEQQAKVIWANAYGGSPADSLRKWADFTEDQLITFNADYKAFVNAVLEGVETQSIDESFALYLREKGVLRG